MRREECLEMFSVIPDKLHPQINLVMRNQASIAIDAAVRYEQSYVVVRGREGGTTDEGRAFFVPYEDISYIRIERVMKISELQMMFGETGVIDHEDKLGQQVEADNIAKAEAEARLIEGVITPIPIHVPNDPASIAKQNLLNRIRAARANASTANKNGVK